MPRPEKGTPRKLRIWLERCKPKPDDVLDLTSSANGETVILASWCVGDVLADAAFEAHVFELAQANADERGCTTHYVVRHMRDDAQRGQYEIRCRASDAEEGSDFDGSPGMLVQGLYRQNERLLSHALAQSNATVQPLMKALEGANARIAQLEGERAKLADELHKLREQTWSQVRELKQATGEQEEKYMDRLEKLFMYAKAAGVIGEG